MTPSYVDAMSMWDVYQHIQIKGVRRAQVSAELDSLSRDSRLDDRIEAVDDRVEQVLVLTEAVWELCSRKLGITTADLEAEIAAIQERELAQRAAGPLRCPSCDAVVPDNRDSCQFCGFAVDRPRSFR